MESSSEHGFYTELAIDEVGPKKLLISEHDGHYTVNSEGKVIAIIKGSGKDHWEQLDGDTLSPFALKLLGKAIREHGL